MTLFLDQGAHRILAPGLSALGKVAQEFGARGLIVNVADDDVVADNDDGHHHEFGRPIFSCSRPCSRVLATLSSTSKIADAQARVLGLRAGQENVRAAFE